MSTPSLTGLEQVVRGVSILASAGARIASVAHAPRPLLVVGRPDGLLDDETRRGLDRLAEGVARLVAGPKVDRVVRSVPFGELATVLEDGCDLDPTTEVLFVVHSVEQALDFPDEESRLLLLYDARALPPSWQEVPVDIDERQLAALQRNYPTRLRSGDGHRYWLTRLPEGDPRIATRFEVEHARWIQGSPWDALLGVIALGRDHDDTLGEVREAVSVCVAQSWEL